MFMTFKFPDKLAIRQKGWFWFCNEEHWVKTSDNKNKTLGIMYFIVHTNSPIGPLQNKAEKQKSDGTAQKG